MPAFKNEKEGTQFLAAVECFFEFANVDHD